MKIACKKIRRFLESTVFLYFMECFFGFAMAIATFHIFPLSVEIAGFLVAFFGFLLGAVATFFFKKTLNHIVCFEMLISAVVFVFYHMLTFPFCTYTANGLYLGILTGVLLFLQIDYLSKKQHIKSGIWYLFGLLLGILLKRKNLLTNEIKCDILYLLTDFTTFYKKEL